MLLVPPFPSLHSRVQCLFQLVNLRDLTRHNKRSFILHNLITQDEIRRLIETAERKGMSEALITPYGSNNLVPSTTRTNTAAWLDVSLWFRCRK